MTSYALTKLATQLVYPLSVAIALALVGLIALARGRTRSGGALVAIAVTLLWLASMPAVSLVLNEPLQLRYPPIPAAAATNADAIVLLGGALSGAEPPLNWVDLDDSGDRILHAARLYRAGKAPWIVVSDGGGSRDAAQTVADATADLLVEWGVPRDAILVESASRNTYENAIFTKRLLDARGIHGPVLLVTSALHMRRAVLLFESAGVEVVPAPTDYTLDRLRHAHRVTWLPDSNALHATDAVIKERLGILVDRIRGRIRQPES